MVKIPEDSIFEESSKSIYELIAEAVHEATRNNIKANSIVINKNLVKVPERFGEYPTMICGLKTYNVSCDLPDDYLFAVLQDYRPMTNADRIRAMSDEKLVEHFWEVFPDEKFCSGECNEERNCDLCRLAWLKQPAEVE